MKSAQELRDLYGDEYVESFNLNQSPARLERLQPFLALRATDRVVDFACGNGMLMPLVAPHVASYTGVDFSEPFIRAARHRLSRSTIANADFRCSDIEAFCREHPGRFDVAFAMDFSEHVYDEDWLRILSHIRTSLTPHGRLYLHTPNAEFFLEKMKSRNFIVKQFPEHIAVRTPAQNVALLKKAGFAVAQVRLLPHYNSLRLLHPLSALPLIGRYFRARLLIEATPAG